MPEKNSNTLNILHEVWSPRFKWFQPPMWPIFRWAYKIKRTLLVGCYPISMGTNADDMPKQDGTSTQNEVALQFSCSSIKDGLLDSSRIAYLKQQCADAVHKQDEKKEGDS